MQRQIDSRRNTRAGPDVLVLHKNTILFDNRPWRGVAKTGDHIVMGRALLPGE
ncbi:hypothetical protein D1872_332960 [compost metagenome]